MSAPESTHPDSRPQQFAPTRWSLIAAAGDVATPQSRAALESLCRSYWYPIYAEVRRRGHAPHDAQDLVQDFFARLLRTGAIPRADRGLGRFRSYLLGALNHFLVDQYDRAHRQKRGGDVEILPLDGVEAEGRWQNEIAAPGATPEQEFDRRWALTLLDRAYHRLEEEQTAAGRAQTFALLKPFLGSDVDEGGYDSVAAELGLNRPAVASAVYRLRTRFRQLVRDEAAQTVANPADAFSELRALLGG
jgi:RNA polymerase sigma factor (sigma-70 family)